MHLDLPARPRPWRASSHPAALAGLRGAVGRREIPTGETADGRRRCERLREFLKAPVSVFNCAIYFIAWATLP